MPDKRVVSSNLNFDYLYSRPTQTRTGFSPYQSRYSLPDVLFAPIPVITRRPDPVTMTPSTTVSRFPQDPDDNDMQDNGNMSEDNWSVDPADVVDSEAEDDGDAAPGAAVPSTAPAATGKGGAAAVQAKDRWDFDADIVLVFTIFDKIRFSPEMITIVKTRLDALGYDFTEKQISKHYSHLKTKGSFTNVKCNCINVVKGRGSMDKRYGKAAKEARANGTPLAATPKTAGKATPKATKTTPSTGVAPKPKQVVKKKADAEPEGQTPAKKQKVTKDVGADKAVSFNPAGQMQAQSRSVSKNTTKQSTVNNGLQEAESLMMTPEQKEAMDEIRLQAALEAELGMSAQNLGHDMAGETKAVKTKKPTITQAKITVKRTKQKPMISQKRIIDSSEPDNSDSETDLPEIGKIMKGLAAAKPKSKLQTEVLKNKTKGQFKDTAQSKDAKVNSVVKADKIQDDSNTQIDATKKNAEFTADALDRIMTGAMVEVQKSPELSINGITDKSADTEVVGALEAERYPDVEDRIMSGVAPMFQTNGEDEESTGLMSDGALEAELNDFIGNAEKDATKLEIDQSNNFVLGRHAVETDTLKVQIDNQVVQVQTLKAEAEEGQMGEAPEGFFEQPANVGFDNIFQAMEIEDGQVQAPIVGTAFENGQGIFEPAHNMVQAVGFDSEKVALAAEGDEGKDNCSKTTAEVNNVQHSNGTADSGLAEEIKHAATSALAAVEAVVSDAATAVAKGLGQVNDETAAEAQEVVQAEEDLKKVTDEAKAEAEKV